MDSAGKIGQETTLHEVADCSRKWWWEGGRDQILTVFRKSAPTFLVPQRLEALWTNGVDGQIQRTKPVSNSLSTKV
jgi:hypothetical protein